MANREKGEVAITVDGQDYVLVLDLEALCQLEDLLSTKDREVTFIEAMERAQRGSARHVRAVLWASMLRHRPEAALMDASAFLTAVGGMAKLNELLLSVAASMQPDVEDLPTKGRPRRAQATSGAAGTGAMRASRPGASA